MSSENFTFRGKDIVLSKTRGRPFKGLVAKGRKRGMYDDTKRIEVVTKYALIGKVDTVSELTNVPVSTINIWRKEDWFQELLREIREENNEKIDAKFTEIVETALEQIQDRLEQGDYLYDRKLGTLIRVPVGVRDLSLVAAINVDKRQLLRGLPTSRTEQVRGPDAGKLEKLAEAFEALANKRKPRVIDVEIINDNQEDGQRVQGSIGEVGQEPRGSENPSGGEETTGSGGILQTQEG